MTEISMAVRELTDAELFEVGGGQDVPVSNLTIVLDPGQCINVTEGNATKHICGRASSAALGTLFSALDAATKVTTIVCLICGLRLALRADRRANRVVHIP